MLEETRSMSYRFTEILNSDKYLGTEHQNMIRLGALLSSVPRLAAVAVFGVDRDINTG